MTFPWAFFFPIYNFVPVPSSVSTGGVFPQVVLEPVKTMETVLKIAINCFSEVLKCIREKLQEDIQIYYHKKDPVSKF